MAHLADKEDTHAEMALGYRFHPKQEMDSPGYPGLDIVIHAKPTGHHFDPESVRLTVASPLVGNRTEQLTVHHGWREPDHYHVCAGYVTLIDRNNKTVTAFAFGGSLDISIYQDHTLVSLISLAPILHLTRDHNQSIPLFLASEVEALLAERRAMWQKHKEDSFEERLASVDPLSLYRACIEGLNAKLAKYSHKEGEFTQQFLHFLQNEAMRLQQSSGISQQLASLDDLL